MSSFSSSVAPPFSTGLSLFVGGIGGPGSVDGTGNAARFSLPRDAVVDNSGNVYVTDFGNHTIRKITPAGVVTTIVGKAGESGSADGEGVNARFNGPEGIAIDNLGNLYVADSRNHVIRKINTAFQVSTLAGSPGVAASADGTGSDAKFYYPSGVAVHPTTNNLYVVDRNNCTIRMVTAAGVVSTITGAVSSCVTTDGALANARFYYPRGIAVGSNGDIYVSDQEVIRKISAGTVSTIAGLDGQRSMQNGIGSAARFNNLYMFAIDVQDNLYAVDEDNHNVRKINTTTGEVSTLAGNLDSGWNDGEGANAQFRSPTGIAVDGNGNVYVADAENHLLRKISSNNVSTLAGSVGISGHVNATGSAAQFNKPIGLATDADGNLYISDSNNNEIRKATPEGAVSDFFYAYNPHGLTLDSTNTFLFKGSFYFNGIHKIDLTTNLMSLLAGDAGQGSTDDTGSAARFNKPIDLKVDSSGNLYVADSYNYTLRKITPGGVVTTLAGSPGNSGFVNEIGSAARFTLPKGIALDTSGNIYIADGKTIRKVTSETNVSLFAGSNNFGFADGIGSAALFSGAISVAVDPATNNIYVADSDNHVIRKITPDGTVSTVVGQPRTGGFQPGELPGLIAFPRYVHVAGDKLYISMDNAVVVVTPLP